MSTEPQLFAGIDPNRPSAARIYDCFLGGTHNFASDRAVAARAIELVPEVPKIAKANRAFLHRSVAMGMAMGIRQFLDLGSGIPTEGNVHEVVHADHPGARVVYVDLDPTAVLHARDILDDDPHTLAMQGDLLRPEEILGNPEVRRLFDLDQPICLLMIAVLHFIPGGPTLTAALRHYRESVAAGSLLAISHATPGNRPGELDRLADLYNRTGTPLVLRDHHEVATLFEGWDLVEPGIVYTPRWRPDPGTEQGDDPASYLTFAGAAVRP